MIRFLHGGKVCIPREESKNRKKQSVVSEDFSRVFYDCTKFAPPRQGIAILCVLFAKAAVFWASRVVFAAASARNWSSAQFTCRSGNKKGLKALYAGQKDALRRVVQKMKGLGLEGEYIRQITQDVI
ncbi:MAG: hypothetical protein IJP81_02305 [Bacteroidales bacterium]|nr:hypothetical protein [Bacteroidales bacterium]